MTFFWLFLAGIAGGFISGLLGVGGGIIFLLILPFSLIDFGIIEQNLVRFIVANSLFGVFFASLAGNITHISTKTFHLREVSFVALAGSLAAIFTLEFIVLQEWYTRWIFNLLVILFLIYILLTRFLRYLKNEDENDRSEPKPFHLSIAGLAGGVLSALSGTGGGAITVPILNHWLKMDIKIAKSVSLGMILLSSMVMTFSNLFKSDVYQYSDWQQGLILYPIVIPLTLGVIIGAPLGVKSSHKMTSRTISGIFAILIIIVILEKFLELYQLFT